MPLSTKELVRNIPKEPDARNARYVHVKNRKLLGLNHYLYTTITKIPGDFSRQHKIWVKSLDKGDIMASQAVWVSCDCDRFQFVWEYALTKKGASTIRFSNGDPPVEKNPRLHAAGCKHVYRVLADLAQRKQVVKKTATRTPIRPTTR